MATAVREVIYTREDFYSLPESTDGKRYELIDGDLIVSPSPDYFHARIVQNVNYLLDHFVRQNNLGVVLCSPYDIELTENFIVVPDLIYISNKRQSIITRRNAQGAPDLLVEVHSPSNASRDRGVKRKRYQQYGVREYWMVDPDKRSLTVCDFDKDVERVYGEADTFDCPSLPGLTVTVADVFK